MYLHFYQIAYIYSSFWNYIITGDDGIQLKRQETLTVGYITH